MAFVIRLQHTSVPMPAGGDERARTFYGAVLGMTEKKPPSTLRNVVWFEAGPDGQEVHCFTDPDFEKRERQQHLCLQVEDLETLRAHLKQHDIPMEATTAITNRPRFFVRDPFQNLVELTQIIGEYD